VLLRLRVCARGAFLCEIKRTLSFTPSSSSRLPSPPSSSDSASLLYPFGLGRDDVSSYAHVQLLPYMHFFFISRERRTPSLCGRWIFKLLSTLIFCPFLLWGLYLLYVRTVCTSLFIYYALFSLRPMHSIFVAPSCEKIWKFIWFNIYYHLKKIKHHSLFLYHLLFFGEKPAPLFHFPAPTKSS